MKRKLLILPAIVLLFGLSACQESNSSYQMYRRYLATLEGNEPISYADWLNHLKGKDGSDAPMPNFEIGENGHYYVNGEDTGVTAKGDKGEKGDKGQKGDKGEKGETGEDAVTPYELYKSLHPDYDKSENGFYLDLANGRTGEQVYHSVLFVIDNNDMLTLQVIHGEKVSKPDFTALQGVSIAYWTYQNEAWNFNASVTEDMTLVAVLE